MKYVVSILALVLAAACVAGAWRLQDTGDRQRSASRAGRSRSHAIAKGADASTLTAAVRPAPSAHRLLVTDRELLEPELSIEEGTVPTGGSSTASYTLRIPKRTLALGEPLEASVSVRDAASKRLPFRVIAQDILRVDGGYSEPGGSWSEQTTADGVNLSWTPDDLPAPTGARELLVTIELNGEERSLTAAFSIGAGSPITLTGKVLERRRSGALEIDVEVEAKLSWECDLTANLYDTAGEPLQHTSWSGVVGPGIGHAALQFSQEIQADTHTLSAPIVVRQFRGQCRRAADPEAAAVPVPLVEELYRTG